MPTGGGLSIMSNRANVQTTAIGNRRILLCNQSTTYLFRSLCDRLASAVPSRRFFLLAGSCEFDPAVQSRFTYLKSTVLVRTPAWRRFLTWGAFSLRFLCTVVFRRFELVVVTTNPPLCPWIIAMLPRILRPPYIVIEYDVYPDVLSRIGGLRENSCLYRFLVWLSARTMRLAEAVVTLGEDMAEHLRRHSPGSPPEITVIPNWSDTSIYRPVDKHDNVFAREHGLLDRFVVMYSGAFGATHDIESILDAAEAVSDLDDVVFVLIGKGTRYPEIQARIQRCATTNVLLIPWQPIEMAPLSLAAADCHLVTLDSPYAGISFPSKFYTSLGVGAAVLAVAPQDTDLWKTVSEHGIGQCVRPGEPHSLAQAIRTLYENPDELCCIQRRSRALAEELYDEQRCCERYAKLVERALRSCERQGDRN